MAESPKVSQTKAADVGYGRPPLHTRWKSGQSGNPQGRAPKKPKAKSASPPLDDQQLATYQVGPGRPPLHSRWKPGQSGNPRGRRRKTLPRKDVLKEVLLSPFPVKIGSRVEMIPALDVMLMRIRVRALEGDQKAIRYLTELFGSRTALVETVKSRAEKLDLVRMFGW